MNLLLKGLNKQSIKTRKEILLKKLNNKLQIWFKSVGY